MCGALREAGRGLKGDNRGEREREKGHYWAPGGRGRRENEFKQYDQI